MCNVYFDYFCQLQTFIIILSRIYQCFSCTYLQWKTWRSWEPQTSNLTAPQWHPPVCFTSSIYRSKRDRHDHFTLIGIWALSVHKPCFLQFNHKEQKRMNLIWRLLLCNSDVFTKSPALVTALNSFNHSSINQAKVYYWIITCIINCLAIQAFDPAANNVYTK